MPVYSSAVHNSGVVDGQQSLVGRWQITFSDTEVLVPAVCALDLSRIAHGLQSRFVFDPKKLTDFGPRLPQTDGGNLVRCTATVGSPYRSLVRDFFSFVKAFDRDEKKMSMVIICSGVTFALHQIEYIFENIGQVFVMFEIADHGQTSLFLVHNAQAQVFLFMIKAVPVRSQIDGKKYYLVIYPYSVIRHFNASLTDALFLRNMPIRH